MFPNIVSSYHRLNKNGHSTICWNIESETCPDCRIKIAWRKEKYFTHSTGICGPFCNNIHVVLNSKLAE